MLPCKRICNCILYIVLVEHTSVYVYSIVSPLCCTSTISKYTKWNNGLSAPRRIFIESELQKRFQYNKTFMRPLHNTIHYCL